MIAFLNIQAVHADAQSQKKTPSKSGLFARLKSQTANANAGKTILMQAGEKHITSVLSQTKIADSWQDAAKTEFEYAGSRLLARREYSKNFANGSWELGSQVVSTINGIQDTQTVQFLQNNTLIDDEREITRYSSYRYTTDAIALWTVYQDKAETGWVNTALDSTFVSGQTITGGASYFWTEEWKPETRFELVQEGADLVELNYGWDGFSWVLFERTRFINADVSSVLVTLQELEKEEFSWGLSAIFARLPEFLNEKLENDVWVPVEKIWKIETRDAENKLIKSEIFSEVFEGTDWIVEGVYVAEFDAQNRISTGAFEYSIESERLRVFEEGYQYGSGDLDAVEVKALNFESGQMIVTNRYLLNWAVPSAAGRELPNEPGFVLEPAFPNPFNPSTQIPFTLSNSASVTLALYDLNGRRISTLIDGRVAAGSHFVLLNAQNLASGTYVVRLQTGSGVQSRKITLIK